jgi:hypothetical protein
LTVCLLKKLLSIYIEDQLEIDQWFEIIVKNPNARHVFLFEQILTSKEIINLLTSARQSWHLKDLLVLLISGAKGEQEHGYLKAKPLNSYDPSQGNCIVSILSI